MWTVRVCTRAPSSACASVRYWTSLSCAVIAVRYPKNPASVEPVNCHPARMRSATVSLVMLLALAPATALAGCASEDDPAPAGTLRHWRAEAPPLPPPDPAAYPRAAAPRAPVSTTRPRSAKAAPQRSARSATEPRAAVAAASEPQPGGAPSDEEVARELREALGARRDTSARSLVERATLTADGLATVPPGAPARVAAIIRGANEVARKPYVYGGGHGRLAGETWIDTAYDCSGSVSFALANAGLVDTPMVSGALASWGD